MDDSEAPVLYQKVDERRLWDIPFNLDILECNATTGVIVQCVFWDLVLHRVKPYQGFSEMMHRYQVDPCSRLM